MIAQFSPCFSKCHGVEWSDGAAIIPVQSMELKPPCGATGVGIMPGNQTIMLSWHLRHIPSAVINLTIEELSLPILSINCDYSHLKVNDGMSLNKNLCGKQPKQMLYSRSYVTIELLAGVLDAKFCFSYSYGWYYEAAIADKDIHLLGKPPQPGINTPVEVKLSIPVDSAKGTFLIVSDFLKNNEIMTVTVSSGLSILNIYDGPGPMSPMIIRLMEYSNVSLNVQFYLYLEFYKLGSDDNNTYIYYETVNSLFYPDQKQDQNIVGGVHLQCRNKMYFLRLNDNKTYADVTVKSDPDVNIWCRVQAVGKGMVLQLQTFKFDGPTVQHINKNYMMCQFGGVYITVNRRTSREKFMSLCDENMLSRQELLMDIDDGLVCVYIVYFAGYSEGSAALKLKTGPRTNVQIGQQCKGGQQKHCKFTHKIWTEMSVKFSGKGIMMDDVYALQFINPPLLSWQQQYTTANMPSTLHMLAGSPTGDINLGTVQLHIEIITAKSLAASCFHQLSLNAVSGNSNTKISSVDNVLSTNQTIAFPSAKYISITIQLCSYLRVRNRVIVTVKLEKHKVCDVVNLFPWPSQIADDCSHLSLPYHLGSISFYSVFLHTYELTISDGCVDKSCLEITISANGYHTNKCDVLWENIDVSSSPIKISFPGKLNITWYTKPSCSASLDELRNCDLEIDVQFDEFPQAIGEGQSKILKKTSDRIVLQRETRKDTIFLRE